MTTNDELQAARNDEIRTEAVSFLKVDSITESADYSTGAPVEFITGDFDTLISASINRHAELLERLAKQ